MHGETLNKICRLGIIVSCLTIDQAGSNEPIYLGCKTETDREQWLSALHTSSYECMRMQLDSLREQITLRTGQDPINSPHSSPVVNSTLGNSLSISLTHLAYIHHNPLKIICASCAKFHI